MLGWFHAIMPKEQRFFELFAAHSKVVVAGAEAMRAMLEGGEGVEKHCQTVMERENDADAITREVLMAVRRTFITPFDRGDITDLITAMDNAIDQMQKTAKGILLFEVRSFTPQMRAMGDTIVQCAKLVRGSDPAVALDQCAGRPHQRDLRADFASRRPRRRAARCRFEGALPPAFKVEFDRFLSSVTRSTITWKK